MGRLIMAYWDCPYCGNQGNKGSLQQCPSCGRARGDVKFYMNNVFDSVPRTELAKELRERYIKTPPEDMSADEIRDMSDDDLLDMDYFLHEFDVLDDDDFCEEGFYIF